MHSEVEFIRKLQLQFSAQAPVLQGIGDDGAVLDTSLHDRQVVVTDMLLDGVHFDLKQISPDLAGRKAMAVNLSDLAAMACSPDAAFVSIAVSKAAQPSESFLQDLYSGISTIAQQYEFTIAGGDTNAWDGPFAINVCMTGTPFQDEPILRTGAKPGDVLLVTGPLGGSLATGRHLTFEPRLGLSRELTSGLRVTAMMDISDGLALDLHRMMAASDCGAIVRGDQIPVHDDVPSTLPPSERIKRALSDGEDFELLMAVASDDRKRVDAAIAAGTLLEVGTVTNEVGKVMLRADDGALIPLAASGWQHLQSTEMKGEQ